jgi:hypothetical protein
MSLDFRIIRYAQLADRDSALNLVCDGDTLQKVRIIIEIARASVSN